MVVLLFAKLELPSRMVRVRLGCCCLELLASWICGPVRRTGGWAPREGMKRNRVGSALLALGAMLGLKETAFGLRRRVSLRTARLRWELVLQECACQGESKDSSVQKERRRYAGKIIRSIASAGFALGGLPSLAENQGRQEQSGDGVCPANSPN